MTIQKKFSLYLSIALCFLFAIQMNAQGPKGKRGLSKQVDQLKEELQITDEQSAEIAQIKQAFREDMKAQRQSGERATPESRKAAKQRLESQINDVLTPDQQAKLATIKAEKQELKKQRKAKFSEMKKELRSYHKENERPVLIEQRSKLDAMMSAEDLQKTADLKMAYQAYKAEKKGRKGAKSGEMKGKGKRKGGKKGKAKRQRHSQAKGLMGFLRSDVQHQETANKLVATYTEAIDRLSAEIADERAQWKADKAAIVEKYASEAGEAKREMRKKKMGERKQKGAADRERMEKLNFILLDTEAKSGKRKKGKKQAHAAKVFPNPSGHTQTLEFETKTSGPVNVTIVDKNGQVVKEVFDGQLESGTHSMQVDVQDLTGFIHYYRINNADGQTSKKILVTKE